MDLKRTGMLLTACAACATIAAAQVSVRTGTFSFGKPVLTVRASIAGDDGAWLNSGSTGSIQLTVTNSGTTAARGTIVVITPAASLGDLQIPNRDSLGDVRPGETRQMNIAIASPAGAAARKGSATITLWSEASQAGAETKVDLSVRVVPVPRLDVARSGGNDPAVAGEATRLTVRVSNRGTAEARSVSLTARPVSGAVDPGLMETGKTIPVGKIAPGAFRDVTLTIRPPAGSAGDAALAVAVAEERQRFSMTDTVTLGVVAKAPGPAEEGLAYFARGDYRGAVSAFQKAIAAGKGTKEVYAGLGRTFFALRNKPRCLSAMEKASAMGSDDARSWLDMHTSSTEIVNVRYTDAGEGPFKGYDPPIGIGMLAFTDSVGAESSLGDTLYSALRAKNKSFRIFPWSTIKSEFNAKGLTSLENDLSMNFAVGGNLKSGPPGAFAIKIARCKDSEVVSTVEFQNSRTSTALDDAVGYILKGNVPHYTRTTTRDVIFP